jgi:hypothetical protein
VQVRHLAFAFLAILTVFPSAAPAQRKEKAEAIKTAAQLFGTDSKQALESLRTLLQSSLAFTPDDDPQAVTSKLKTAFVATDAKVTDLVSGYMKHDPQERTPPINPDLTKLEELYATYSSAFNALPQGAWFARGTVRNAESLTLRLTKQMSSLADVLLTVPTFGEPINQESAISAAIMKARIETDEKKRTESIDSQVNSLVALRVQFQSDRDNVVKQLLVAAEAGSANYKLMVDFEKIKLLDILSQVQSLFGSIAQSSLPGPRSNLKQWNDKIKSGLDSLEKGPETASLFQ